MTVPQVERATYLGYRLLITDRDVQVSTPDGRPVCSARSVKQARLIVRGYRKADRA